MSLILFDSPREHVGRITLNDPDKLNAMGEDMAVEFQKLTQELKAKRDLRVVILTGAGRAFSAGGDLKMLDKKTTIPGEENRIRMLNYYHAYLSIREIGVPVIAAMNGHAIGAGLCIAAACDVRVCSSKAKLGLTFTRLGLHPGMGATYFLPRLIGPSAAAELMLSGRVIQADEALRVGLVSRVVETDEVVPEAEKIAEEILSCGPEATRQLLRTLYSNPSTLEEALELEARSQAVNYASAEFKEGVTATIEKRPPKF